MITFSRFIERGCAIALLTVALIGTVQAETFPRLKKLGVSPLPNSPEALFLKHDTDRNGFLDVNELTRYVIDSNEMYSKARFKALYETDPKYRAAVQVEAREEADKITADNGISNPNRSGEFGLRLIDLRQYLFGKGKAKPEKFDVLKKITGAKLSDEHLHIIKNLT